MPRRCTAVLAFVLPVLAVGADPGARGVVDADLQTLAEAEELMAIDTGYFTSLENLDDLTGPTIVHPFDYILDGGGTLVIRPNTGRWEATRVDVLHQVSGMNYMGPYVAYQAGHIDDSQSTYDEGSPLDPWGNPYLLFTPLGLAAPKTATIDLTFQEDSFDRYAIVSLGPDGVVSNDDAYRTFGTGVTTLQISSVRVVPGTGRAAYELRIKGYSFGSMQGTGAILQNGSDLAGTPAWTDSLVTLPLAAAPPAGTTYALRTNTGATTRALEVKFTQAPSDVADWMMY